MKLIAAILKTYLVVIIFGVMPGLLKGETICVFYNTEIPQHSFAANDIKSALELKSYSVQLINLTELSGGFSGKKIIIALASNSDVQTLMKSEGVLKPASLSEQAYALRTSTHPAKSYWVLGGDKNGTMYGGLQLAENIHFNGFDGIYNEEDSPYLKNRGVKFNIPLDFKAPTYFHSHGGTSHKLAIRNVWDMNFWITWFDEMARHRYNVLSLWHPHPFTSMINMEEEYPGIAINGVTGFDKNGDKVKVNNLTINEKVDFWQGVMQYGKDRGFDIYFCTWNIFLNTAEGLHGLTDLPDNQKTRDYLIACTKKFFETYQNLSGLGVTVGERMHGLNNNQKEEWAWNTYGRGILEYAKNNPERELVFIHRQHQGDVSDIIQYFQPLIDQPNVRFDLSFKYSKAHAHATTTPDYWERAKMERALSQHNLKSWLTVRNDDWYFLHWADPQFVRNYVKNIPEVDKYVNAFYIGADGWVFTKVFTNKDPYYEQRDMLSIQRTWFMQKLWGRISYNPSISDEFFKNHLALKFPQTNVGGLFEAWSDVSRSIQLANEQVTGTWNLDFKWWPEGWTSKDGFLSLEETRKVVPMNGSEMCSFEKTANGDCGNEISAFSTANEIEQLAKGALAVLENLNPASNKELQLTLENLHAMAYLSLYNANKFRAAIYLEKDNQKEALKFIGIASCFWKKYTNTMDELFIGVELQRNFDFINWHAHDKDALQDYLDLGGEGEPDCSAK